MRVVAAMSGGVDSAVAAARMLDAGHDVVGVHLALSRSAATLRESARGCCTIEDAGDARRVADRLGIGIVDVDGPRALLELPDDAEGRERASDELLRTVMTRASIREYAEVLPQLADIYREVA